MQHIVRTQQTWLEMLDGIGGPLRGSVMKRLIPLMAAFLLAASVSAQTSPVEAEV